MKWISVKIYTSKDGIEPLSGRLYLIGVGGVQIEDADDFNEFIDTCSPHWDYIDESLEYMKTVDTSVSTYLTDDDAGNELLSLIRETVSAMRAADTEHRFGSLRIEVEGRDDSEWVDNWKKYYKPFSVGSRLLVVPSWETVDNPENRTVLTLDPGHLFGSGTHHSTRMCLEQLDSCIGGGERILDLGCGSGILAITALLLGAKEAVCVDIDASAPNVVGENLALNGIDSERCRVLVGNVLDDQSFTEKIGNNFDIVIANIVADVIIGLSDKVFEYIKKDGLFIVSGIIEEREASVSDAIVAAGFVPEKVIHQGGWSCLSFRYRG